MSSRGKQKFQGKVTLVLGLNKAILVLGIMKILGYQCKYLFQGQGTKATCFQVFTDVNGMICTMNHYVTARTCHLYKTHTF